MGRAEKGVEGGSKEREGAGKHLRLATARVAGSWRWMPEGKMWPSSHVGQR
jgi:hypothetical protein